MVDEVLPHAPEVIADERRIDRPVVDGANGI
jgi:hypothetical protein